MKHLEARVERLETLEQLACPGSQQPPFGLDEFAAKLDRMRVEWTVENARRQKLTFEEQIELLKADRDQKRTKLAERELAGEVSISAMDVFSMRVAEVLIAQLEKKIRERDVD